MAHTKRGKSSAAGGKKQAVAKNSLKKKHLSSIKSKNDHLREKLDQQAQLLYPIQAQTDIFSNIDNLCANPSADDDVDQVTAILESFCQ